MFDDRITQRDSEAASSGFTDLLAAILGNDRETLENSQKQLARGFKNVARQTVNVEAGTEDAALVLELERRVKSFVADLTENAQEWIDEHVPVGNRDTLLKIFEIDQVTFSEAKAGDIDISGPDRLCVLAQIKNSRSQYMSFCFDAAKNCLWNVGYEPTAIAFVWRRSRPDAFEVHQLHSEASFIKECERIAQRSVPAQLLNCAPGLFGSDILDTAIYKAVASMQSRVPLSYVQNFGIQLVEVKSGSNGQFLFCLASGDMERLCKVEYNKKQGTYSIRTEVPKYSE